MLVIGVSSRKGGGKSTLAKFLLDNADLLWPQVDKASILKRSRPTRTAYLPFAAPLKDFCVNIMGLPREKVYGTDADKETLTTYRWQDMPHYLSIAEQTRELVNIRATAEFNTWWASHGEGAPGQGDLMWIMDREGELYSERIPRGFMTVRQVLQEVGTGIGRCMDPDIWCKAWRRSVQNSQADVVVVDDARFGNELDFALEENTVLIRLLRGVSGDSHASETSLTDDDGRWEIVVDNCDIPISEVNQDVVRTLAACGYVEPVNAERTLRANNLWGG